MNEQRKHPRFHHRLEACLEPVDPALSSGLTDAVECLVTNLSESGMSILSESEIQSGAVLRVRLDIEDEAGQTHTLEIKAVMRWMSDEAGPPYAAGMQFLELDPQTEAILASCLAAIRPD